MLTRLLFGLALLAVTAAASAQPASAPRHVRNLPGHPLTELIKPGDRTLEVERFLDPPLMMDPPEDVPVVEYLFDHASGIVVARIEEKKGTLTSAQDFVRSLVSASILEVLKTPPGMVLRKGDRVSFWDDGGEVMVDGTRIIATRSETRLIESGGVYLMLIDRGKNGELITDSLSAAELKAGRFVHLFRQPERPDQVERPDAIERDYSEHVLSELRDVAQRRRDSKPAR